MVMELNGLQVYTLLTASELEVKPLVYKELYWQNPSISSVGYGPFVSIYDACAHYTKFTNEMKQNKANNLINIKPAALIHVDFKGKKRL
jgi:hypothetical protein